MSFFHKSYLCRSFIKIRAVIRSEAAVTQILNKEFQRSMIKIANRTFGDGVKDTLPNFAIRLFDCLKLARRAVITSTERVRKGCSREYIPKYITVHIVYTYLYM